MIFCIQISDFNKEITEAKDLMDNTFLILLAYVLSISLSSLLVAIIASAILVGRVIEPLKKLTLFAKAVNETAHSRDENKKMRKKLNFDIDQLQVL